MKKRYIILLVIIVSLILGIAFPFLQAAHQMKEYLRSVNPHFAPYVRLFATYNPVDGAFNSVLRMIPVPASFLNVCLMDKLIIEGEDYEKY